MPAVTAKQPGSGANGLAWYSPIALWLDARAGSRYFKSLPMAGPNATTETVSLWRFGRTANS